MKIRFGDQNIRPIPPADIADAVMLWGREQGRRFGRLEWNHVMNTWVIHFGRKSDDPLMRAWQEGTLQQAEEPTESIYLNEWDKATKKFRPLPLEEYGVEGIRRLLDEANMWSGRGRYNSLQEGVNAIRAQNHQVRENLKKQIREAGRETDWLHRRSLLGIPYITAGINLKPKATR